MTDAEFAVLARFLAGAFRDSTFTEENFEAYRLALADLPYTAVQQAALRHVRTAKWFPTISELAQGVAEEAAQLPDAEAAWAEVAAMLRRARNAIASQGSYSLAPWSNPMTGLVVDALGGWQHLVESDEPAGVLRAHFLRLFDSFRTRSVEGANLDSAGVGTARPRLASSSVPISVARLLPGAIRGE